MATLCFRLVPPGVLTVNPSQFAGVVFDCRGASCGISLVVSSTRVPPFGLPIPMSLAYGQKIGRSALLREINFLRCVPRSPARSFRFSSGAPGIPVARHRNTPSDTREILCVLNTENENVLKNLIYYELERRKTNDETRTNDTVA